MYCWSHRVSVIALFRYTFIAPIQPIKADLIALVLFSGMFVKRDWFMRVLHNNAHLELLKFLYNFADGVTGSL